MTREIDRRRLLGCGLGVASALVVGISDVAAQATPAADIKPHGESTRDTSSWFIASDEAGAGFVSSADAFRVFDGAGEPLGGFRAVGTSEIGLTGDPARVLLDMAGGPASFSLATGEVTPIVFDTREPVTSVLLPDARFAPVAPPRWAFFPNYRRGLLADLDASTGLDLAELFPPAEGLEYYPAIVFAANGRWAAATVGWQGFFLFDPADAAGYRPLAGGDPGSVSFSPQFSPDGERIAFVARAADDFGPGTLIVQATASGEEIWRTTTGEAAFAVWLPDSDDELLVFEPGTVRRVRSDDQQDVWQAPAERIPWAWAVDGDRLLYASMATGPGDIQWQTIDLESGFGLPIAELRGLTYYNSEHPAPDAGFQVFGPPEATYGSNARFVGPLVALERETNTVVPLLPEVPGDGLTGALTIAADGSGIAYVPRTGDPVVQTFTLPGGPTGSHALPGADPTYSYLRIAPDGATAAVHAWDSTAAVSQMTAYLLDVRRGTAPEMFVEGRIWTWAGSVVPTATTATLRYAPWAGMRGLAGR